MALQLKALEEETALLALFDTMNWSRVLSTWIWRKTYQVAQRVGFHGMNFFLLGFQGKVKLCKEKVKALRSRSFVRRGCEANDRAILTYIPRPYPGKIAYFRPMVQYARCSSPELKWSQLAHGGRELISLPVYPAGRLLGLFVKHLADSLRGAIDKATSLAA